MSALLYIDAVAGVAGDMLLGALIDAGASEAAVRSGLEGLGAGVRLELSRTERHGIGAARVSIAGPREHVHRTWADVRELIDAAAMPGRAADRAHDAFRRLAEAEGRIHGKPADEVHFHEVGAIDAIGDVCGVALALEDLGIDRVACSSLPAPQGFVRAAHGTLPLPAPATLELLAGAPLHGVDLAVELVTPTGAALVAALATEFGPLPPMRLRATGYGAGERDLAEIPNLVRVLVGEPLAEAGRAPVCLIEANLDDMPGELVPDAAEACRAAGALDVWATPVQMKKGRPGVVLSALARPADERAVAEAILRGTSTIGVRTARLERWELDREMHTVEVAGEAVAVKIARLDGEVVNVAPEHDDCAAAAARSGLSVKEVWSRALAAAREGIDRGA